MGERADGSAAHLRPTQRGAPPSAAGLFAWLAWGQARARCVFLTLVRAGEEASSGAGLLRRLLCRGVRAIALTAFLERVSGMSARRTAKDGERILLEEQRAMAIRAVQPHWP